MSLEMIVGFASSPHYNLVTTQHAALKWIVSKLSLSMFIHGGGFGSDTLVHYAVRAAHPGIPIAIIPSGQNDGSIVTVPNDPQKNIITAPQPTAVRDKIMIKICHGLIIAAPGAKHDKRSRAWQIKVAAEEAGVPYIMLWPNGSAEVNRSDEI